VVIELDPNALDWTTSHPAGSRLAAVFGSAADEAVTERAADFAQAKGSLAGWVNNAAVFSDAAIDSAPTRRVLDLIAVNFEPAVVGVPPRSAGSWPPQRRVPSLTSALQ
jgi:NAD(P)-dependent dehydrogenase (short-subunit alcohol dehydrogenase family)